MTLTRGWWFVSLIGVPALLAALALLWAGPPAPEALPVVGASPAVPVPVAAPDPTSAPDPTPAASPDPVLAPVAAPVAEVLAAQPIRFTADSAVLSGPSVDTAQRVAQLLVAGPVVPVLVEGHVADTPGGPDAVQRLSDDRAAVVAQALVAAGVPAERITARGVGATRPLATAEESRRVEITLG